MSDEPSMCFVCRNQISAGSRVKVQHGTGPDGGGLHLDCWVRLTSEADWLRAVSKEARRYLATGNMDPQERILLAIIALDRGEMGDV